MRTEIKQLAIGVSVIILFAVALSRGAINLDQNQPNSPNGNSLGLFAMGDLAQSFQQEHANVAGEGILMGNSSYSGSDTITIALYDGLPNEGGTKLAEGSATYTGSDPGTWLDVYWTPVSVTPNTTLYLVFTETHPALFGIAGSGNTYSRGQLYQGTGFQPYPDYDYAFRTYYQKNADAGPDVSIYTSEQALATAILHGSASGWDPGTAMQYQWFEDDGTTALVSGTVGDNGEAPLSLSSLSPLSIGVHTFRLEVTDGTHTSSDTMVLTVNNTPPEPEVAPISQEVQIGLDAITVTAEVADFDGDTVSYQWVKDGVVLESGTATPPALGAPVAIDDLIIAAGDPRFPLGTYQITLVVNDGANPPVTSNTATVTVKDTTAPTLMPTASTTLLWPPNHQLVPITIWASAADNGGGAITLGASVESDEPECQWCHRRCGHHCGHWTQADWYIDSIDNNTGVIQLRLRSERYPWGDGRVYTVTITATDGSGNQSTATVEIRVPHDKRRR